MKNPRKQTQKNNTTWGEKWVLEPQFKHFRDRIDEYRRHKGDDRASEIMLDLLMEMYAILSTESNVFKLKKNK